MAFLFGFVGTFRTIVPIHFIVVRVHTNFVYFHGISVPEAALTLFTGVKFHKSFSGVLDVREHLETYFFTETCRGVLEPFNDEMGFKVAFFANVVLDGDFFTE